VSHSSPLRQSNNERSAHPWLQERVYGPKRQRTVALVTRSVDALVKEKQRVSLSSVVVKSKELDANGKGISESAILDNDEARAYYEQHRTWRGTCRKYARPVEVSSTSTTGQVKLDRDEARVRQRYLRMSKPALVDRLLTVEQEYAEHRERWLLEQDEVLTWRLRAEQAEVQLKKRNAEPIETLS
jgi:hypothetical protein